MADSSVHGRRLRQRARDNLTLIIIFRLLDALSGRL